MSFIFRMVAMRFSFFLEVPSAQFTMQVCSIYSIFFIWKAFSLFHFPHYLARTRMQCIFYKLNSKEFQRIVANSFQLSSILNEKYVRQMFAEKNAPMPENEKKITNTREMVKINWRLKAWNSQVGIRGHSLCTLYASVQRLLFASTTFECVLCKHFALFVEFIKTAPNGRIKQLCVSCFDCIALDECVWNALFCLSRLFEIRKSFSIDFWATI